MHAKNLSFDDGTKTEIVEDLHAVLPSIGISVLTHIFVIVAINTGNLARFVVPSEESDVGGVLDFEAHK